MEINKRLKKALIPPHPLTNLKTKDYYENESRFNGVHSRDNLPNKIKSGAYVVNVDEYNNVGTHWIAVYCKNNNEAIHFDSFGIEHIPLEVKKFIDHKNKTNIFRLQAYNSIMCGFFCIKFIDFMLKDKSLVEFTSLFSPYDFKKSDDIILSYFK